MSQRDFRRFNDDENRGEAPQRRREERFPVPVDVELVAPGGDPDLPEIALLRDISPHGVGLVHMRPLNIGDLVSCTLLDTPVDLPCRYQIEILWQEAAEDGRILSGGRIVAEYPTHVD